MLFKKILLVFVIFINSMYITVLSLNSLPLLLYNDYQHCGIFFFLKIFIIINYIQKYSKTISILKRFTPETVLNVVFVFITSRAFKQDPN